MVVGSIFALLNINNIYHHIFGDSDQGIVLLNYSTQGNNYTFMKRSVKRSIYIQIMLFSVDGIYTLFKDREQELMIFAKGNIYRETGTVSPCRREVEHKSFVQQKIKSEKIKIKYFRHLVYYLVIHPPTFQPPADGAWCKISCIVTGERFLS